MEPLFKTQEIKKVAVYTDGGARGNPGPAAIGVVIKYNQTKKSYGEAIGETTNNVAEYSAVIFALKKLKQIFGKEKTRQIEAEFFMDSELLARQLNGEYKIEEPRLQLLFMEIWNLKIDFKKIIFTHIRREKNREADAEVNRALDGK